MHTLLIYPTSRAIRIASEKLKQENALLPTLMRMDEFERRVALVQGKRLVDPIQRTLFLHQAAKFSEFALLNIDHELIRFYTKSDAIFKFFEELSLEGVEWSDLVIADTYDEFEHHLEILQRLRDGYHNILTQMDLTDRAFIPRSYQINEGFLDNFDSIEMYVEGYLSRYELELLGEIAKRKQVVIHYVTSSFNTKMRERFKEYGIALPADSQVSFDFNKKEILKVKENKVVIDAKVYQVEERYEQISVAFEEIELMVRSGIKPSSIALILPDESIKEAISLYDLLDNFNFAMGFEYRKTREYKRLGALYDFWKSFDEESRTLLAYYEIVYDEIAHLNAAQKCDCTNFLDQMIAAGLLSLKEKSLIGEKVLERYEYFLKIFGDQILRMSEWLFFWMQALDSIVIDDIRGGKVTIMGVLETRGIVFDGVVIIDFNEGVVPASSSKDQFLNSAVRTQAGLPTHDDRESLQKQYYKRLLEQAKQSVILCCGSDNRLPSKFLYELGLNDPERITASLSMLYSEKSQFIERVDAQVEDFDASDVVWSASRLKTFLECKRKYYYRYIRKIPQKQEDEPNEGAFLHRILEALFRKKAYYESLEAINTDLDRLFDAMLPSGTPQSLYKRLLWREKLQKFFQAQIGHFEEGWRVEACEVAISGEIGGLRFKGCVDRIDRLDLKRLLIDYKSGSIEEANKGKNLESLTDFQMNIYHALLSERYEDIDLAFIQILDGGLCVSFVGLEEKHLLLLEQIEKLKSIKSFTASKCDNLNLCRYCEFALMCERGEYL